MSDYNDFLVNVWSKELSRLGLIPPDETIRDSGFDKNRSKSLMKKLKALNISIHDDMVAKFSKFGVIF